MKRLANDFFEEFERCTVKVNIFKRVEDKQQPIHSFFMDADKEIDIALEALEWIQENVDWGESKKVYFDYEVTDFKYENILV